MTAQPVTVRFWASARAAAGVDSVEVAVMGPVTLDDVVRRVLADAGRLLGARRRQARRDPEA